MASFNPSRKTELDFNNGVKYIDHDESAGINGDGLQAETINNLVENALYTQGEMDKAVSSAAQAAASAMLAQNSASQANDSAESAKTAAQNSASSAASANTAASSASSSASDSAKSAQEAQASAKNAQDSAKTAEEKAKSAESLAASAAQKTDLQNYVTIGTSQEITGQKTFSAEKTAFLNRGVLIEKSFSGSHNSVSVGDDTPGYYTEYRYGEILYWYENEEGEETASQIIFPKNGGTLALKEDIPSSLNIPEFRSSGGNVWKIPNCSSWDFYYPNQSAVRIPAISIFPNGGSISICNDQSDKTGIATSVDYKYDGIFYAITSNSGENETYNIKFPKKNGTFALVEDLSNAAALAAYPVGAYYMSNNPTSPAALFGGTWASEDRGRFPRPARSGSYSTTGGSNSVTLVADNIPPHIHNIRVGGDIVSEGGYTAFAGGADDSRIASDWVKENNTTTSPISTIPEYFNVYLWRRTA